MNTLTLPKPIDRLFKLALTAGVATALSLSAGAALAQQENPDAIKTYTDPTTGELKVAPKLLSQMTPEEKAQLSAQEKKLLQDVEKLVEEQAQQKPE